LSLRDVLDVLGRRWPLSVVVLLLTLGVGWLVAHPAPTYTASEIFAVEPPVSPQVPNQLNVFRPSLAITAAAVAQRLKTPDGEARLRSRGLVGKYDVVPRNSGTVQTPAYIIPSLRAEVIANSQDVALRSVEVLTSVFREELSAMQDEWDVAATQRITVAVLAPASAVVLVPSRSRALAGVAILGLAGAIVLPLWYEQIRRRRARRVAERAADRPATPRTRLSTSIRSR
jgi:hypothetical protein